MAVDVPCLVHVSARSRRIQVSTVTIASALHVEGYVDGRSSESDEALYQAARGQLSPI